MVPPPLREKAIALFNAMTEACSAETLNTVTITGDVRRPYNSNIPIGDAREEYIIQPSALTPLFKFTNLRQLWLQGIWCLDLDDTFVLQACRAWPKLSAFVLDPNHHWPESNLRITIGVLESFPPQATTNSPSIIHAKLNTLLLSNSVLGKSEGEVAVFLSKIFPNLKSVDAQSFSGGYPDMNDMLLCRMPDLIRTIIEVREEEGRWLKGEDIPVRGAAVS